LSERSRSNVSEFLPLPDISAGYVGDACVTP
jgi:hypothetical protein